MKSAKRLNLTDLALGVAAVLFATATSAAPIDYDSRRAAPLRRCDEMQHHGRVDPARECYEALLRTGDALARAEAAFALGDVRSANELFRAAVAADNGPLPRVRWGRLYISTQQYGDAVKLFQEALERDKKDVGAHLALARVAVERFDGDIQQELDQLLKDDPNLLEAHLIAARLAIEQGRYDDAVRSAQRARDLAVQQKQPPLEAFAMLAAVEVMRERDPAEPIRQALEYNPRYGDMFVLLGYLDVMRRLYREADVWLQRAV